MDSICFYKPSRTKAASSYKATRSPFIRGRPAAMPSGGGRQHATWVAALECVEVVEIVDLTAYNQQRGHIVKRQPGSNGSDRVQGGDTPKALKGDRVKNGADGDGHNGDGSDDDDLPPLRDILSGMKPKGAVENGALSLKRRVLTQQPVAASGLRGDPAKADAGTGAAALEPGDSEGNPIELDHDGLDDTTARMDHRSLDSTSVGGQPGVCPSFGDLSSEIAVSDQHIDSAPTEDVSDDRKADNLNHRSVNEGSVDDGQRPQPAAHQRCDWSVPDGQIATGASECNSSGRVPPASAGNVYDVFAEFERTLGRDRPRHKHQRWQHRLSSSDLSDSALEHPVASIGAAETPYSTASGPSITGDDATPNHSRHYGHRNFNRDNDEDSGAEPPKSLVPPNKGLRGILHLAPVIQPPNAPPTYDCSEASRQLARVAPLMSSSLPVFAAEAVRNNDLLDTPAGRPTGTDGQELYVDYDNREGLDNKLSTGQTPPSPPQAVSTLHHSPLSVSGSARTRSTEISQVPSRTDGQDLTRNKTARTDRHKDEDHTSPLLKERRSLNASSSGDALLPDVSARPRRTQRPPTRPRRPKRSIARGGGTASLESTPVLQATTSSKANWKSHGANLRPILDGKEVCVGDYVFVRCGDDSDDEEGGAKSPEIAKVEKVYSDGRLRVLWAYHPAHPNVPQELEFGPYEILLSDHKDTVQVGCLMGFAEVEENCESCGCAPHWCWNKRYKARQRKIVVKDRQAKRRRLGV